MNPPGNYRAFEEIRECAICGGGRLATVDPGASVVRCLGCGHRFVSP